MFKKLLTTLLLITMTPTVFAWGQTGHRVTGAIAEIYLTDKAKKQVKKILGTESLAEASTWPDEMRSNPADFWQKTASPYHYVSIPKGKTYPEVGAPAQGDSVTALKKFTAILKDPKSTLEQRQLALRFVVHIAGDLHQPLHAGNGTDRGGNDVKLTFFGEDSNLHRVWDSGLIDRQNLSYTEMSDWLSRRITKKQAKDWRVADPQVWIAESAKIRDTIYPESDRISWDYNYQNIDTVKTRLSQGGVRIATYLNELFK
jgi:hypothetical protein